MLIERANLVATFCQIDRNELNLLFMVDSSLTLVP